MGRRFPNIIDSGYRSTQLQKYIEMEADLEDSYSNNVEESRRLAMNESFVLNTGVVPYTSSPKRGTVTSPQRMFPSAPVMTSDQGMIMGDPPMRLTRDSGISELDVSAIMKTSVVPFPNTIATEL